MRPLFLLSVVILTFGFLIPGCGSGNQKLSGKVTFSDNDEPLTRGIICFQMGPNSSMSRGTIQSDGTYVVGSLKKNDGLPLGTYEVFITGAISTNINKNGHETVEPLIHSKYSDVKTSGLTFTANGKTRTFDIRVDRAQ